KSQRKELGVTEYPLFSHREIEGLERSWTCTPTRRPFPIGRDCDGIECEFFDAGHVVGSVGVMLRTGGRSIFYTGDVHFADQTLSRAADFPEEQEQIHTAIIETTRGAEERPATYTRENEIRRFACAVQATLERGGSVLIPLFALGKTQEILTIIDRLKRDERILNVPVYIGGLSAKMTNVYDKHAASSHRYRGDFRILEHMDLVLSSSRKRRGRGRRSDIPFSPGMIYALSSGMMTENTLSNKFAKNILPDPVNSLLFVGYCAPDSPGGRILASAPGEAFSLNDEGPPLPLACQVEKFDFSGHSTREEMRAFLLRTQPSRIFLVHGDEPAISWFERSLSEDLPASHVTVPLPGEAIPMANGYC
ncbi:MAG: MBL fold metallo-hydrolase, partial [Verrucomicrobiales bacterium]